MASDVITYSTRLRVVNGSVTLDRQVQDTADQTGGKFSYITQSVPAAYHVLAAISTEVGAVGWTHLRNLDSTDYVEVGLDVGSTFVPVMKLLAGESAIFRLATEQLYMQADNADVDVEVLVLEA